MTIHQQYPLPNHGPAPAESVEYDDSMSPSDGYFGDRRAQFPNAVFLPASHTMEKAQEATSEQSGSFSPLANPQQSFTPRTTGVTPASSCRDSDNANTAYSGSYRDALQNVLVEDDEAPPEYSEAPTSTWSETASTLVSHNQHRDASAHEVSTALAPELVTITLDETFLEGIWAKDC